MGKPNTQQIAKNIWVFEDNFKILGTNFGIRMTVIKTNNNLLLYSPIPINSKIKKQISDHGKIKYLIAPNSFHHLHINQWASKFSEAKIIGPKILAKKQSSINFTRLFNHKLDFSFGENIKHEILVGKKNNRELVLFETNSQTLIVADMFFNLEPKNSWEKLIIYLFGFPKSAGTSKVFRWLYKPNPQLKKSVQNILKWPIKQVIMSHGAIWEKTNPEQIKQKLAWVLAKSC